MPLKLCGGCQLSHLQPHTLSPWLGSGKSSWEGVHGAACLAMVAIHTQRWITTDMVKISRHWAFSCEAKRSAKCIPPNVGGEPTPTIMLCSMQWALVADVHQYTTTDLSVLTKTVTVSGAENALVQRTLPKAWVWAFHHSAQHNNRMHPLSWLA